MTFRLNDKEWAVLQRIPVEDLVELAAELDILIPEEVDRRELIELCVPKMVERGRASGIPLSKYDVEDLEALGPDELAALATIQGSRATVSAILRSGAKVYRALQKNRRSNDPFAYMVPVLLGPLLRHAVEQGLHR